MRIRARVLRWSGGLCGRFTVLGGLYIMSIIHSRVYKCARYIIEHIARRMIKGKIPLRSLSDLSRNCYLSINLSGDGLFCTKYGSVEVSARGNIINYCRHRAYIVF